MAVGVRDEEVQASLADGAKYNEPSWENRWENRGMMRETMFLSSETS